MSNLDPNHSDWSTERPPVYHPGHDSPYPVFHTYERDREVYTAPFAQQTLGPPSRPVSTSRHGDNRGGGYYGFDYYDNYPGAPRGLNPDWQAAHGVGTVHGWYEQTGLNGFYGMERPGGPLRPPPLSLHPLAAAFPPNTLTRGTHSRSGCVLTLL